MTHSPDLSGHQSSDGSADEAVERLRVQHGVRPLTSEEEGFSPERLPNGVYGYAYAPAEDEVPLFAAKSYHSFEMHKAADGGVFLIGYLTPEDASQLEAGKEGAALQLFPDPWEKAQTLVSVPVSKMLTAKKILRREVGNPLHFTIT